MKAMMVKPLNPAPSLRPFRVLLVFSSVVIPARVRAHTTPGLLPLHARRGGCEQDRGVRLREPQGASQSQTCDVRSLATMTCPAMTSIQVLHTAMRDVFDKPNSAAAGLFHASIETVIEAVLPRDMLQARVASCGSSGAFCVSSGAGEAEGVVREDGQGEDVSAARDERGRAEDAEGQRRGDEGGLLSREGFFLGTARA
eukprot:1125780-Rhodomonas_salina.2